MLIPNHPDPELLSALASGDADAAADPSLSGHVSACVRCTALVDELGALRMSLAELPDLRPHRPLRLLPEVADQPARVDRVGGWARRFFAPVLTAGAALAMVGLIGTSVPALEGLGASGAASQTEFQLERPGLGAEVETRASDEPDSGTYEGGEVRTDAPTPMSSASDNEGRLSTDEEPETAGDGSALFRDSAVERSPWPMVLFTGVALMVAAGLLRWILAPRGP